VNYTDTMRDVKAAVQAERDQARREMFLANLETIDREHAKMKEELLTLRIAAAGVASAKDASDITIATKVLSERVEGLTWLVRGVIVAVVLEIIGGTVVAFIVHGMKT
jgi:hypothetical protein